MTDLLRAANHFLAHAQVPSVLQVDGTAAAPPLVSIMIPTYRRPLLLGHAIASALQQQGDMAFEVVVVDNDDSGDDTVKQLVRRFAAPHLRLFRNAANLGMFGNWNRCLTLARGRWVVLLNDDDLLEPGFLAATLAVAAAHPAASMVQAGYRWFHNATEGLATDPAHGAAGQARTMAAPTAAEPVQLVRLLFQNDRMGSLGILYSTAVARQLGGFNPAEYPTADYNLHLRWLAQGHPAVRFAQPLAHYRVHQNESVRPSVLVAFVANAYHLRMDAAHLLRWPALARLLTRWTVASDLWSHERAWHVVLPDQDLGAALGFPVQVVRVLPWRLLLVLRQRLLRWILWQASGSR